MVIWTMRLPIFYIMYYLCKLFLLQGDIILEVPYLIEFVTKFINISGNYKLLNINKLGVNKK